MNADKTKHFAACLRFGIPPKQAVRVAKAEVEFANRRMAERKRGGG